MFNNNEFEKIYLNIISEQTEKAEKISYLDKLIEDYINKEEITEDDIAALLNIAICDELLAAFNYRISYNISKTEGKQDFDPEFEAHEDEEDDHADKLIDRLREMNKGVLMIPWCDYLTKNSCGEDWKQESSENSLEILQNRYNEELNAVKFYSMILACIEKMIEKDTTTEQLIKNIKGDEEEHAKDLRDLLIQYGVNVDNEIVKNEETIETEEDESDSEEENNSEDNTNE